MTTRSRYHIFLSFNNFYCLRKAGKPNLQPHSCCSLWWLSVKLTQFRHLLFLHFVEKYIREWPGHPTYNLFKDHLFEFTTFQILGFFQSCQIIIFFDHFSWNAPAWRTVPTTSHLILAFLAFELILWNKFISNEN